MMEVIEKRIKLNGIDILGLLGVNDQNLQIIEDRFNANIIFRGENLILQGTIEEVDKIEKIFREMIFLLNRSKQLTRKDIDIIIDLVTEGEEVKTEDSDDIILYTKSDCIKVRNNGQKEYYKKVKSSDLVFAIGPAGTGKTYLAVAFAVANLKKGVIQKIILTRPAVEAGESLGFLPGDFREKIDPYLRPLYDALDDMLPPDKLKSYIEKRIIEIIPLAYMRGRTLNNAFVILDEAQNATSMQMKMFLTRLGNNSKAIITGDITQIDLPTKTTSGLVQIQDILHGIKDISFVYFDKNDVVRHKLVRDIINAYEKFNLIHEEPAPKTDEQQSEINSNN
jgi:phosphate starvation-inducible protein PhoH and related proteins